MIPIALCGKFIMKYHVTYEMMDRELRFPGKLIRTIYPVMTESIYGMVNRGYISFSSEDSFIAAPPYSS